MKRYAHLLLAPTALLYQALPLLFIYHATELSFGEVPAWPEYWVWPASVAGLAVLALAGLALASRASYLLLTRSRGIVAVLLILLFCMPAWLLSVFYLHGVLVFLAWV